MYNITFKHYRTGVELTLTGYPMDDYNKRKDSEMFIFYDTLNERIEAIIRSSIVSMLAYEDEL